MGISNSCTHAKVSLKKVPKYPTGDFGISLLLLHAAEHETCDECGEVLGEIHVPNVPGLIAAAAVYRVGFAQKLTGSEIKFIRKALKMSSKRLADLLSITAETLSRCENNKMPMNPTTEKVFRVLAGLHLASEAPAVSFDAKEILSMKIAAVRSPEDEVEMKLGLVKFKEDKKVSEAYSEAA